MRVGQKADHWVDKTAGMKVGLKAAMMGEMWVVKMAGKMAGS